MPPIIRANARGSSTHASEAKPTTLSVYRANPALLNPEIAWKTPSHAARGQP